MILQESGEMYLETILQLQQKQGKVRAIDVAEQMNFTKASVSRAMSILKRENFILVEAGGNIVLTDAGLAKAQEVLERHKVLTRFFAEHIGVPADIAEHDAAAGMALGIDDDGHRKKIFACRSDDCDGSGRRSFLID